MAKDDGTQSGGQPGEAGRFREERFVLIGLLSLFGLIGAFLFFVVAIGGGLGT